MTGTVLLTHSSGPQGPGEGSDPLVRRLREELGAEYEVLFPKMPGIEDPHYEPWRDRLAAELAGVEGRVIVFGHSLGGSVALKYAAEGGLEDRVAGLVIAGAPYWGQSEWEREWALPGDWAGEETRLPPVVLFHSRDDEVSPFAHLDLYAKRLTEAEVHPLDGNGHLFDRGDLSEVIAAVRSL
ncbi:MAG: alpha/beta fold hydrolase [Solirubrobacterales bacterium]